MPVKVPSLNSGSESQLVISLLLRLSMILGVSGFLGIISPKVLENYRARFIQVTNNEVTPLKNHNLRAASVYRVR